MVNGRTTIMLACLAGVMACSSTIDVSAGASRFPNPRAGERLRLPICLPSPPANASLAERATWTERMDACARAATQEGVTVATAPGERCLQADMVFSSEFAGKARAMCALHDCNIAGIHRKTLRMALRDASTQEVVMESVALIESRQRAILNDSVFALCSATFRGYPNMARNEQHTIEIRK